MTLTLGITVGPEVELGAEENENMFLTLDILKFNFVYKNIQ